MQDQVTRMKGSIGAMPRRAQFAVAAVIIVTIIVMFFVVRAATATTWVPAIDRVPQGKLADAQGALEKAGVASEIGETGALMVPKPQLAEANAALSEANVAGAGSHTSCERMTGDSASFMAATSAQQKQRDRSCLQNEIANMIERVGAIESAEVALTLPEDELFSDEQTPAKASVSVDTSGARLTNENVQAITSLVTNSVKGLNADMVTIVDESGHAYGAGGSDASVSASELKLRVEDRFNLTREQQLIKYFEDIAGSGKVKVKSNVELDMDAIEREVKDVGGENNDQGIKDSEKFDAEVLSRKDEPVGGTAGTATNANGDETPTGPLSEDDNGSTAGAADETGADNDNRVLAVDPEAAAAEGADYVKEAGGITYSNDEVREAIKVAPGKVLRNRLSIVVDTTVPAETFNAVKNSAETYLGGNAADSFSIDSAEIAKLDENRAGTQRFEEASSYIKWVILGLALIAMAFMLRRTLNRREEELLYPMDDMLALEPAFDPVPLRELEAAVNASATMDNARRLDLERKVTMIAQDKPDEVAQMLRGWLHDNDSYGKRSA